MTTPLSDGPRLSGEPRLTVLLVMFIPSVQRDGVTPVKQKRWVEEALTVLGTVFSGATAFPKARGVWRDDENAGRLVRDEPVVIHCYTTPEAIEDEDNLAQLLGFCRAMGGATKQGEVGLVIGDEYLAIRKF